MSNPVDKTCFDPRFDPDAAVEQQVREVYRQLPEPEPGAELDARIRSVVAAELSGREQERAPIIFPWWRRMAVPLALAATVVLTLGLGAGWFWMGPEADTRGTTIDLLAQAPVPALTPAPAYESAPAAPLAKVESPAIPREVQEASDFLRLDSAGSADVRVTGNGNQQSSSPPPKALASVSEAAVAFEEGNTPVEQEVPREPGESVPTVSGRLPTAVVPAMQPSRAEQRADKSKVSAFPLSDELRTLEKIRTLLAANQREEARLLLRKWKQDHPAAVIPADLQELAREKTE